MKAMILAAGKGERMRPLTLDTPKPLLSAGGQPLIRYHIENLARAGITELVINPSWLGDKLEEALGDGSTLGVRIDWSREPEPLETAGGIRQALPLLTGSGDEWFVIINGDIWTDFDLTNLIDPEKYPLSSTDKAVLVLTDNPAHHPVGDFHLSSSGRVSNNEEPRLTFTGISLLHHSLFESLSTGYRKLAPVLEQAIAANRVAGIHHDGLWFDIGTPRRLEQLDAQLRQRQRNSSDPTGKGKV